MLFRARVKNFIKWWMIWAAYFFIGAAIASIGDLSAFTLQELGLILFFSLAINAAKGFYNIMEHKMPWGLRNMRP